ncbi:MAG: type II toxin-antitoxin system VapB family antitoxin [Opitutales bacterium]
MCSLSHMPSNLAIDDELLLRAQKLGKKRTKKDTVNEALTEYVQRREQKKILALFGTVDYYENYDPKQFRR